MHRKRPFWLLMIPLLLLISWLGARGLGADSIWVDELRSLQRAGDPRFMADDAVVTPEHVWNATVTARYQVPGYYVVLAGWGRLVGLSDFGGRALSLLLGVLVVAGVYRLGREWHSPLVGLGAAVSLGMSAFYINYLHDMRAYTLLMVLSFAVLWCYWRLLHRDSWLLRAALFLSVVAVLYTHYAAFLLMGTVGLYHLVVAPKSRRWLVISLIIVLAGLTFLPWLPNLEYTFSFAQDDPRQERALSTLQAIQQLLLLFSNTGALLWAAVALLALKVRGKAAGLIWFLLVAGLAITLLIHSQVPFIFDLRYLIVFWIPLALVFGLGLVQLQAVKLNPYWLVGLWLVGGLWAGLGTDYAAVIHDPVFHPQFLPVTEFMTRHAQSEDYVLMIASKADADRGSYQNILPLYITDMKADVLKVDQDLAESVYADRVREIILNEPPRLWLYYDPDRRPWGLSLADRVLHENGYALCGNRLTLPGATIDLYAAQASALTGDFANTDHVIRIGIVELYPQTYDEPLSIALGWLLDADALDYRYSVALHVIDDSSGERVSQVDVGLHSDDFQCTIAQFPQLPTGDYHVELFVYAWETGERLQVMETENSSLRLISFRVG